MLEGTQQQCAFADRCAHASADCREAAPPLQVDATGARSLACWHPVAGPTNAMTPPTEEGPQAGPRLQTPNDRKDAP
jgi:hypothetical protein